MTLQQIREDVNSNQLFNLLQSDNDATVEDIKQVIHENLNTDTKEPWLVNALVDFYLSTESDRCLDILIGVREQHYKHLYDKLCECLKSTNTRSSSLTLLGHIIRRQPSWLYKLVSHPIMNMLLKILKTETSVLILTNAVLTIVTLLPMVPSLIAQHLSEIFDIFCQLITKKSRIGNAPEVHIHHLRIAVNELFLRLYGMYPCNCIAHLRNYVDNHKDTAFQLVEKITPMLNQVKIHPMLITATKESEVTNARWKRQAPHDVVAECAKISLDNCDSTKDEAASFHHSMMLGTCSFDSFCNSQSYLNYAQSSVIPSEDVNMSLSSPGISENVHAGLRRSASTAGSVLSHSISSFKSMPVSTASLNTGSLVASSGVMYDLSTPPPTPSHKLSSSQSELNSSNSVALRDSPTLEVGVDAMASASGFGDIKSDESLQMSPQKMSSQQSSIVHSPNTSLPATPSLKENIFKFPSATGDLLQKSPVKLWYQKKRHFSSGEKHPISVDLRKSVSPSDLSRAIAKLNVTSKEADDAADREVEQIVERERMTMSASLSDSPRKDSAPMTPFLSTTKNLTTNNVTLRSSNVDLLRARSREEHEYDLSHRTSLEASVNQNDPQSMSKIICSINRLRFLSQCYPQTDQSTGMSRRKSCPELERERSIVRKDHDSSCSSCSSGGRRKFRSDTNTDHRKFSLPTMPPDSHIVMTTSSYSTTDQKSHIYVDKTWNRVGIDQSQVPTESCDVPRMKPAETLIEKHAPTASFVTQHVISQSSVPTAAVNPSIEFFERYNQLGSEIYAPITTSKSTKWTHFGGKPPPDEIDILRGQIQLLYYQLLFERHKREMHAQRNRRLLGRIKAAESYQEQNSAMRDQLELQEKEVHRLRKQSDQFERRYSEIEKDLHAQSEILFTNNRDVLRENENLRFSNEEFKKLLISHTDENNILRMELATLKNKYFNVSEELCLIQKQVEENSELKQQIETLNKELALMGELHQRYKEKLNRLPNVKHEKEYEMLKEICDRETTELKKRLENKEIVVQTQHARIVEFETTLINKDLVIAEQKNLLEKETVISNEKIKAVEEKYLAMRKVCQQLELHIQDETEITETSRRAREIKIRHDGKSRHKNAETSSDSDAKNMSVNSSSSENGAVCGQFDKDIFGDISFGSSHSSSPKNRPQVQFKGQSPNTSDHSSTNGAVDS